MFKWLKKEWYKKGCFYRVIRTFFQVGISTAAVLLIDYITQLNTSGVQEILIISITTALSAVMNINKKKEGEKNE